MYQNCTFQNKYLEVNDMFLLSLETFNTIYTTQTTVQKAYKS